MKMIFNGKYNLLVKIVMFNPMIFTSISAAKSYQMIEKCLIAANGGELRSAAALLNTLGCLTKAGIEQYSDCYTNFDGETLYLSYLFHRFLTVSVKDSEHWKKVFNVSTVWVILIRENLYCSFWSRISDINKRQFKLIIRITFNYLTN